MSPDDQVPPSDVVTEAIEILMSCGHEPPARWLLVDAGNQRLHLMAGSEAGAGWNVSTAEVGLDNREDSGGTPPGFHTIKNKIGDGAGSGTVFESREPVWRIWTEAEGPVGDDLILTRILTLDGCQEGLNRGPGIDSLGRYIYIHGTNHEAAIGAPVSHGCVRMTNPDVIDLFDRIEEGDAVVIV
jgi:hypothetical protein